MFSVTKSFSFCYAHRLLGHEGKCRHLHGHNGLAVVTLSCPELNTLGMVLDFETMKNIIGEWIKNNWDHNFICHFDDPLKGPLVLNIALTRAPYIMAKNPTAENMAKELFNQISTMFISAIRVKSVTIHETDTSCATYFEESNEKSSSSEQTTAGKADSDKSGQP
jgi:6-pyruvoyltetrahydropterin/6-carboxytetrahydropterin synthase